MIIQPISDSEKLLFTTLRIQVEDSIGTGFVFSFNDKAKSQTIPVIITNKHVIKNKVTASTITTLHTGTEDLISVLDENLRVNWTADWVHHPTEDLCCAPFQPLMDLVKEKNKKKVFYRTMLEVHILNDKKLQELNTIEEVIMTGYPSGIYDQKNNLPIMRKGVTATHPAIDYMGYNRGLVDMSCIQGSSGSPILIYNDVGYTNKKGVTTMGSRRILLGILVKTYEKTLEGDIILKEVPTQNIHKSVTNFQINLGVYIEAEELLIVTEEMFIEYRVQRDQSQ